MDQEEKLKVENEQRRLDGQAEKHLKLPKKTKENFLECKENVCSILIHVASIFCDVTFEDALRNNNHQEYDFKNFLMND